MIDRIISYYILIGGKAERDASFLSFRLEVMNIFCIFVAYYLASRKSGARVEIIKRLKIRVI
jgi:hypothetical protein